MKLVSAILLFESLGTSLDAHILGGTEGNSLIERFTSEQLLCLKNIIGYIREKFITGKSIDYVNTEIFLTSQEIRVLEEVDKITRSHSVPTRADSEYLSGELLEHMGRAFVIKEIEKMFYWTDMLTAIFKKIFNNSSSGVQGFIDFAVPAMFWAGLFSIVSNFFGFFTIPYAYAIPVFCTACCLVFISERIPNISRERENYRPSQAVKQTLSDNHKNRELHKARGRIIDHINRLEFIIDGSIKLKSSSVDVNNSRKFVELIAVSANRSHSNISPEILSVLSKYEFDLTATQCFYRINHQKDRQVLYGDQLYLQCVDKFSTQRAPEFLAHVTNIVDLYKQDVMSEIRRIRHYNPPQPESRNPHCLADKCIKSLMSQFDPGLERDLALRLGIISSDGTPSSMKNVEKLELRLRDKWLCEKFTRVISSYMEEKERIESFITTYKENADNAEEIFTTITSRLKLIKECLQYVEKLKIIPKDGPEKSLELLSETSGNPSAAEVYIKTLEVYTQLNSVLERKKSLDRQSMEITMN